MSLKKLRATAKAKAAPPIARVAKRRARANVQETIFQVRAPANETDPGQVATVYFVVEDGTLSITDERGVRDPLLKPFQLRDSDNPATIAKGIVRPKFQEKFSGFNRPLIYGSAGVA